MLDLDLILAHSCAAFVDPDDSMIQTHLIDVHCVRFIVRARLLTVHPSITYEVLDFTTEEI